MPARRHRVILVLSLLAAMLGTLLVGTTTLDPARAAAVGLQAVTSRASAKAALSKVQDTLAGRGHAEPTLALRDLALLQGSLSQDDRDEAAGYLARPTDGGGDQFGDGYTTTQATPVCSDVVCVHYVTTTGDRPDLTDADGDGVPDFVALAVDTLTHVHDTYVGAGYRSPKPDGQKGGNAKVDVYLKDIGDQGLYGYCTTDQKNIGTHRDVWAYCVLDNDYAAAEFPSHTPTQNLQVTAAHEYFHAVQFAYDIGDDGWFMEATATWAEDELYDDVNDNRQYLASSPITRPGESMDQFSGVFHYGTWIFFRYLTESLPASSGAMPTVVRDMWRRADDAPGGADDYSLEAVRKELARRGLPLTQAFTRFSQANRTPGRSYAEGRALHYPSSKLGATYRLTSSRRAAPAFRPTLDHLTSSTVRYTPSSGLTGAGWLLHLDLDLSPRFRGTGAIVTVTKVGAPPSVRYVKLNPAGDAKVRATFVKGETSWVEVTVVNAGDDFDCNKDTRFSCAGKPKDDSRVQQVDATVSR